MAVCKKCGAQIDAGQKFCNKCGAPLNEGAETVAAAKPAEQAGKNKKVGMIAVIAAVAVVAVVLIVALTGGRKTVSVADYAEANFYGLDGKGSANLYIDYAKMGQDIREQVSKSKDKEFLAAVKSMGRENARESYLRNGIELTLDGDTQGSLKNGDTVTATVTADDEVLKALHIKCKKETLSFEAEGLVEAEEFDAFADIEVDFWGMNSDGRADFDNNSTDDICYMYDYFLDKTDGLSNGDTVTLTIDDYNIDEIAEETGKIPAELSKTYIVSGLSSYVTQMNQIDDKALEQMKEGAQDYLLDFVPYGFGYPDEDMLTYLGSYLLTEKNGKDNFMYMVYKIDCADMVGDPSVPPYYNYACCYGPTVDDKGNINYYFDEKPLGEAEFELPQIGGYVYGYASLEELYENCVTPLSDSYACESTVSE